MATSIPRPPLLSVEEYLRLERTSPVRHEYVAGAIHALAGTTRRHNRIALNLARPLMDSAEGGPCRVSVSEVRLRVRDDVYYYPDVMVACGPEPADAYVEDAPCPGSDRAATTADGRSRLGSPPASPSSGEESGLPLRRGRCSENG